MCVVCFFWGGGVVAWMGDSERALGFRVAGGWGGGAGAAWGLGGAWGELPGSHMHASARPWDPLTPLPLPQTAFPTVCATPISLQLLLSIDVAAAVCVLGGAVAGWDAVETDLREAAGRPAAELDSVLVATQVAGSPAAAAARGSTCGRGGGGACGGVGRGAWGVGACALMYVYDWGAGGYGGGRRVAAFCGKLLKCHGPWVLPGTSQAVSTAIGTSCDHSLLPWH